MKAEFEFILVIQFNLFSVWLKYERQNKNFGNFFKDSFKIEQVKY